MSEPGPAISAALDDAEECLARAEPLEAQPHLDRVVALCARLQSTGQLLPEADREAIRQRVARCVEATRALRDALGAELQQQGTLRRAASAYAGTR